MEKQFKIAIIGLGYVGLPLANEFSKYYDVIGFDINSKRIKSLNAGIDSNNELEKNTLSKKNIIFTDKKDYLKNCNVYIVCVPTPIFKSKKPNLKILLSACKIISKYIKKNDIVVFESTVYPSTTETICVPAITKNSKIMCINDNSNSKNGFFVGYSPERINPGDKINNLVNTKKLVSSNSNFALNIIFKLYNKIINAEVIKVNSIQVCEASKIIENIQRDINIALMNEFSNIFRKMNLDTYEIIKYASTKWNFLKFTPGLVGGHCIGVDPYYLSYIAKKNGINPELIVSGRKINDGMYKNVLKRINKLINSHQLNKKNISILIMGYTFKENCSDVRNTQVKNIYDHYIKKSFKVDIYDPFLDIDILDNKKLNFVKKPKINFYNVIIVTVPHEKILKMSLKKINSFRKKKSFVFDLKSSFNRSEYYTL